ncbi:TPA: hypothetical protein N0F65_004676, partial [Lagenidium giganteum]
MELYSRRLKSTERVGSYLDSIRRTQEELMHPDEELAQIVTTNAGGVYPDLLFDPAEPATVKSKRQVELDETDEDDDPLQKTTRRFSSIVRHESLADVKKRTRATNVAKWGTGRENALKAATRQKKTVNIRRDFTCFVKTRSSVSRALRMANGALQPADMEGGVQITVVNEWNQLKEDLLIEQVLYVATAAPNLLSLDYVQKCGFGLTMSQDQKTCWLTQPELKLYFDKVDGIYRMKPPRRVAACGAIFAEDSSERHGRFCHAKMHLVGSTVKNQLRNDERSRFASFDSVP